ncbi:MAG: T9SS C-terminal target domain-containing protein [Stygiobacter sp.]|nr:MAG: T9SS C-terminal target domain-containing protein [Stygiobacter sp.]
MRLRFTYLVLAVVLLSTAVFAQTVVKFSVSPLGISPRDAVKSTTDIYTVASTGLRNVGLGSVNYFKAATTGRKFSTAITWTLTKKPSGSTAAIGATKEKVNDSTQVATFTPDKVGAYTMTVTDGQFTASVNFNAAKYLGYMNTVVNGVDTKLNCKTCHSTTVTAFEKTNHASMFTRAMNGTPGLSGPSDHYSVNCIGCHVTGFDKTTTAINDGFDDLTFTYPTVLAAGGFDKLVTQFPDAMKRANIQCESCHGPASGHMGAVTDERIDATYDPAPCAYCHDSGTHHIFPEQFDSSLHAKAVDESGPGREGCVRCHTGAGFSQYTRSIPTTDPYFDVSYSAITCAGCHNPHDATNHRQLRKVTASLMTKDAKFLEVSEKELGTGVLCVNCHQSRTEAGAAVAAATINFRFGPHHGPQGDMFLSNNMLELGGVKLLSTNHRGYTSNGCVTCHMFGSSTVADANGNIIPVGGHSFRVVTPDGKDNMAACAQCHGGTFQSFHDAKFFINGFGDWDEDKTIEGLQDEVKGMIKGVMDKIKVMLPTNPVSSSTGYPTPQTSWTTQIRSAYWNAITAEEDKSNGLHNPKYIVTGLRGAMKSLGIATDIQKEEGIPTTYSLQQNYPNPFNPSTSIKFSIPKAGNVKLTVYDILGKEVSTLVNNFLNAGEYNFQFNASSANGGLASGIYLYRLETNNFVKTNKMLLMK